MFVRNGELLGSVKAEPKGDPTPESAPAAEEPDANPAEGQVETPPRNASREAWADFLDDQGIEYPEDPEEAGRNDLITLWDNREGGE